jgi:hypothetical protein
MQSTKLKDLVEDCPNFRVFQEFSQEMFDSLNGHEKGDVITVLIQAHGDADTLGFSKITTIAMPRILKLKVTENTQTVLNALEGYPTNKAKHLAYAMIGSSLSHLS